MAAKVHNLKGSKFRQRSESAAVLLERKPSEKRKWKPEELQTLFYHVLSTVAEEHHASLCEALEKPLNIQVTTEEIPEVGERVGKISEAIRTAGGTKGTFKPVSLQLAAQLEKFLKIKAPENAEPLEIVFIRFRLEVSQSSIPQIEKMMSRCVRGYRIPGEGSDDESIKTEDRIKAICQSLYLTSGRVDLVLYEQIRRILDGEAKILVRESTRRMLDQEHSVRLSMIESLWLALRTKGVDAGKTLDLSVHTPQEHAEMLNMLIGLCSAYLSQDSAHADTLLEILSLFAGYYREHQKIEKPWLDIGAASFCIPPKKLERVRSCLYGAGYVAQKCKVDLDGNPVDIAKMQPFSALHLKFPHEDLVKISKEVAAYHNAQDKVLSGMQSHSVIFTGPSCYWQFYPELVAFVQYIELRVPSSAIGALEAASLPHCKELTLKVMQPRGCEKKHPPILNGTHAAALVKQAPQLRRLFLNDCALDVVELDALAEAIKSTPYLTHLKLELTFFSGTVPQVKESLRLLAEALNERRASLDLKIYTQPMVEELPEEPDFEITDEMGKKTIARRKKSFAKEAAKADREAEAQEERLQARQKLARHGTMALLNSLKNAQLTRLKAWFDVWDFRNLELLLGAGHDGGSILLTFNQVAKEVQSFAGGKIGTLDREILHQVGSFKLQLPSHLLRKSVSNPWYPDFIEAIFGCSFTSNMKNPLRILDLSHTNLSAEGLQALVEALALVEDVYHLDLSHNNLCLGEHLKLIRELILGYDGQGCDILSLNLEGNLFTNQRAMEVRPKVPMRKEVPNVPPRLSTSDCSENGATYEACAYAAQDLDMAEHTYEPPPDDYDADESWLDLYGEGTYGDEEAGRYLDLDLYLAAGELVSSENNPGASAYSDEEQYGFGFGSDLDLYDVDIDERPRSSAQPLYSDNGGPAAGGEEGLYDVDITAALAKAASPQPATASTQVTTPKIERKSIEFGFEGQEAIYELEEDRPAQQATSVDEEGLYDVEDLSEEGIQSVQMAHKEQERGAKMPPLLDPAERIKFAKEKTKEQEALEQMPEACALDDLIEDLGRNCKRLRGVYLAGCGWSAHTNEYLQRLLKNLPELCDLSFGISSMPIGEVKKLVAFVAKHTNVQSLHCPHPDLEVQRMLAAFNASRLKRHLQTDSEA